MDKDKHKEKVKIFDEKLKILFDEHFKEEDEVTILTVLIADNPNDSSGVSLAILGSACPVCVQELLAMRILFGGMRHHGSSSSHEEESTKSKSKNDLGYKDV